MTHLSSLYSFKKVLGLLVALFGVVFLTTNVAQAEKLPSIDQNRSDAVIVDPVARMREATIQVDDLFLVNLFREYRNLAEKLLAENELDQNAFYLARKALLVANGRSVSPALVRGWRLNPTAQDELNYARGLLSRFLQDGGNFTAPKAAARAQVAYDCWLEQLDGIDSLLEIAPCRDRFWQAFVQASIVHDRATQGGNELENSHTERFQLWVGDNGLHPQAEAVLDAVFQNWRANPRSITLSYLLPEESKKAERKAAFSRLELLQNKLGELGVGGVALGKGIQLQPSANRKEQSQPEYDAVEIILH